MFNCSQKAQLGLSIIELHKLYLGKCLEYRLDRRKTTYNLDNIDCQVTACCFWGGKDKDDFRIALLKFWILLHSQKFSKRFWFWGFISMSNLL
jgi:hypothetical protein